MSTLPSSSEAAQRAARLEKAQHLREQGIPPYAYSFPVTHLAAELQEQFADLEPGGEREDVQVAVAGRIRARRVMGKLAFFTL
ncbi:lysine--tRNA ligase, partial [Synechococcus sp. R3-13]